MGALSALWASAAHPGELYAILQMLQAARQAKKPHADPKWHFCYDILNRVSRSFAIVIQQLGPDLRDAVCVFYLVLRGLDTVEDDMAIPRDVKVPELLVFYKHLNDPAWSMDCGVKDYRVLMNKFQLVTASHQALSVEHQAVISDITMRMGKGMAEFIDREVVTCADYDLYCHYVAGLVGIGLSRLFVASGSEDADLAKQERLSNAMGLFLQKTNIIRDYLEDIQEEPAPRMFWPREIWGQYAEKLEDFADVERNGAKAVQCLNHMVADALQHAPDSMDYLARLRTSAIFRFAAIPQIMAIATLAACYNNIDVFRKNVKIRRGLSARILMETRSVADVYSYFLAFTGELEAKIPSGERNEAATRASLQRIKSICRDKLASAGAPAKSPVGSPPAVRAAIVAAFAVYAAYAWGLLSEGGVSSVAGDAPLRQLQKWVAILMLLAVVAGATLGWL